MRRPARRRAHTFFFWTIFLLFVAALGYIGLLAFTGESASRVVSNAVVENHQVAKCLVGLAAVAAVCGGIATRHHMH